MRHDLRTATDCELWYAKTADVADPLLIAACEALLTKAEHQQRSEFVFDKDRHEFLVTRALAQWMLARWTGRRRGAPVLDLRDLDDDETRWELGTHDIEGHVVSTCNERVGAKPYAVEIRRASLDELAAKTH
jgi:hypothetical protein